MSRGEPDRGGGEIQNAGHGVVLRRRCIAAASQYYRVGMGKQAERFCQISYFELVLFRMLVNPGSALVVMRFFGFKGNGFIDIYKRFVILIEGDIDSGAVLVEQMGVGAEW